MSFRVATSSGHTVTTGYSPTPPCGPIPPDVGSAPVDSYRPDIDGLRAIAVLAVILNHFDSTLLPGGYLGVDIFFVISGFVITRSLSRPNAGGFGAFLTRFYARRCRRIVPALALCVVISALAVWLLDPGPVISLRTGLTALVGASNVCESARKKDPLGGVIGVQTGPLW